ncbi:MAG: hypothetical protein K8U57_04385 [Planctomycetes bacterium]|nr:hypothetical protein [Planctomycetota bacterium]
MAKNRRGNLCSRLASLERDAGLTHDEGCPQVTVYLPRKDGDTQPCGVISQTAWSRIILYEAEPFDPTLPERSAEHRKP